MKLKKRLTRRHVTDEISIINRKSFRCSTFPGLWSECQFAAEGERHKLSCRRAPSLTKQRRTAQSIHGAIPNGSSMKDPERSLEIMSRGSSYRHLLIVNWGLHSGKDVVDMNFIPLI